jgi:hypothetical protein
MRTWFFVFGFVLICGLGCATLDDMFEKEKEVPLTDVPAEALEAAQGAVDGITITEAEMEDEHGETIYVLEGEANGKEYEIEVTPEGKVLEVEEKAGNNKEDEDKDNDDD